MQWGAPAKLERRIPGGDQVLKQRIRDTAWKIPDKRISRRFPGTAYARRCGAAYAGRCLGQLDLKTASRAVR